MLLRLKRAAALAAAFGAALLLFCEVPVFSDDYEPNDRFEDAALISPGTTIKATINPEGDLDYYRLNIGGEGETIVIYRLTVPSELRPEMRFYTPDAEELTEYRNHSSEQGEELYDSLVVASDGLVIRVSSFTYEESDSSYTLTLTSTAATSGR